jgi:hypothetical protein
LEAAKTNLAEDDKQNKVRQLALIGKAYFLNDEHEHAVINTQRAKDHINDIVDEAERKELQ